MIENSFSSLSTWTSLHPLLTAFVVVWTFIWKGLALWRSAQLRQKYWYVILLVINTMGILEIIYLFFVARHMKVEVIEENQ